MMLERKALQHATVEKSARNATVAAFLDINEIILGIFHRVVQCKSILTGGIAMKNIILMVDW
jgi:hypothetical protein